MVGQHIDARHDIEKLGLSLTFGKIGNVAFSPKSFDIITIWHSLEHTPGPHLAMQKAKSWLKLYGILVIDGPNYDGTDALQIWQE